MGVQRKRIYDSVEPTDGTRVLVDRLWPRGVSKEEARLDDWMKEVAPSDELREWYDHDPDRWQEFQRRYRDELGENDDQIQELLSHARSGTLTLLYATSDREHNNAAVLQNYLNKRLDPDS